MKPSSVITIQIGENIPPIVDYCFKQNRKICEKNGIPFIVSKRERDFYYSTPGKQAEAAKVMTHSCFVNVMIIDWDIEIVYLPDYPECKYPYLGRQENGKNDLFLSWCNSPDCRKIIDQWRYAIVEGKNGVDFTNFMYPSSNKFPEEFYNHYRTYCGYGNIPDTFSSLSDKMQRHLISVSKNTYTARGKKWPIYP